MTSPLSDSSPGRRQLDATFLQKEKNYFKKSEESEICFREPYKERNEIKGNSFIIAPKINSRFFSIDFQSPPSFPVDYPTSGLLRERARTGLRGCRRDLTTG